MAGKGDATEGCQPCPVGMSCAIGSDMANYHPGLEGDGVGTQDLCLCMSANVAALRDWAGGFVRVCVVPWTVKTWRQLALIGERMWGIVRI